MYNVQWVPGVYKGPGDRGTRVPGEYKGPGDRGTKVPGKYYFIRDQGTGVPGYQGRQIKKNSFFEKSSASVENVPTP